MHLHDLWLAMASKCNEKVLPVIDVSLGDSLNNLISNTAWMFQ